MFSISVSFSPVSSPLNAYHENDLLTMENTTTNNNINKNDDEDDEDEDTTCLLGTIQFSKSAFLILHICLRWFRFNFI